MLSMNTSYNTEHQLLIRMSLSDLIHFNIVRTSQIKINGIITDSLSTALHSIMDIIANDTITNLRLHVQSNGDIAAKKLITGSADIDLNRPGNIQITATNDLIVELRVWEASPDFRQPAGVNTILSGVENIEEGD